MLTKKILTGWVTGNLDLNFWHLSVHLIWRDKWWRNVAKSIRVWNWLVFNIPFKLCRKKEQLEKRSRSQNSKVNEKLLFHGTYSENVDLICKENIDWRAQDADRVAHFGQGAYFTEEAILGNTYCMQDSEGLRYMFLAEVLVGSYTKGELSMKRPPLKGDTASNERFDSCVDNMDTPKIYVLFDSDQYYPTYLIQYKMRSKVVC